MNEKSQPIIIKKIKKGGHAFHGGSWKVAFADFAVAMMAFFLVLWLSETATQEQKQYISGYFEDPAGAVMGPGGADSAVIQVNVPQASSEPMEPKNTPFIPIEDVEKLAAEQEQKRLEELRERLLDLVANSPDFKLTREQIEVDIVPQGIRVQIFDKENRAMFRAGSAKLQPFSKQILSKLSQLIKQVQNKVSITGHTDGIPYSGKENYSNWELSADRANAARRQLVKAGMPISQVAKVEGLADSVLLDSKEPANPANRRIAIIILRQSAYEEFQKSSLKSELVDLADEENSKL